MLVLSKRLRNVVLDDQLRSIRSCCLSTVKLDKIRACIVVVIQSEAQSELGRPGQVYEDVSCAIDDRTVPVADRGWIEAGNRGPSGCCLEITCQQA